MTIIGVVIILITLVFVNFLAQKLKEGEIAKVEIFANAYQSVGEDFEKDKNKDVSLELSIIEKIRDIPVIITSANDVVEQAKNFGTRNKDTEYLTKQVAKLKRQGVQPIVTELQKVYYKNSRYLTLLKYFPLIQFLLLMAFVVLGYIGFSTARRSEQNQVWVGMAKETAHQLGTPISAIMAWIEHLKDLPDEESNTDILYELTNDVDRLKLVADRFSKIGSAPVLMLVDIYEELEKCREYMEKRAPRKVAFKFPETQSNAIFVNINPPLFDWVIENLLRNALDAMAGKGEITAMVREDEDFIYIDISDTGKGIPHNKFKTVFQPGFTTKSRGWGLGLSLGKRIIEIYHKGKIFVKNSQIDAGSTFTIKLPKVV